MNYKEKRYGNLDEAIYEYEDKSGLKVYFIPKKGYNKKYAIFGTNFGSINNAFLKEGSTNTSNVPDGIAHFLEHKLFETEDGSAMEKFSKLGAGPNAYTNFTHTAYLFSCTDMFYENLKLLISFVQNPFLTDESIEKEKGIIGQEINMYDDNPGWRVFFNMLGALYHDHPVKIDIAGTIDSIKDINRDLLMDCYNTFYHPSNMVLFISGDLDQNEVFAFLDNNLVDKGKAPEFKVVLPEEKESIVKDYVELRMDVSTPLFQIGIKEDALNLEGKEFVIREMGMKILHEMLFGRSSDLFTDLYQRGLINMGFDFDYVLERSYSYSVLGGESKNPIEVKYVILKYIDDMKQKGLSKTVFERIKKSMKGRFIRKFNNVDKICNSCMRLYFKNTNVFEYYEIFDMITFEQVEKLLNEHFVEEKMALSVVFPNGVEK